MANAAIIHCISQPNGAAAAMVVTIKVVKVVKIHAPTTTGAATDYFSFQIISIINLLIVYKNYRTETGKSETPTVPNMKKPTIIYHRIEQYRIHTHMY